MECEVRALRRELEETRTALRLQTVRCRQLVAAFTTKLQEKKAEVRAGKELRDRQLGCVLRALLVLEARLRREQRHIRQQLSERDNVIRIQKLEIARLSEVRHERSEFYCIRVSIFSSLSFFTDIFPLLVSFVHIIIIIISGTAALTGASRR
jgi:hypothetical protein